MKHPHRYAIYVSYIGDDGREHDYGDNNHRITWRTKFYHTAAEDAETAVNEVVKRWRQFPNVQMVTFAHVWEVGNDDNCMSW